MPEYSKNLDCINCRKKNSVFCLLNEDQLARMNQNKYEVKFNAGEIIFKQESPMTHVACITEGLVKIYLEGHSKKRLLLKLALPGEIIGGPGLLIDNKHHYTATAVTDTNTCFVDAGVFEENLRVNSDFALAMIQRINLSAIRNFDALLNHTQKLMPGRVAGAILYLYHHVYKTNPFYLTINRQDIADLASMTKESLIRVLKELKDSEIIEIDGNKVRILNERKLAEINEKG